MEVPSWAQSIFVSPAWTDGEALGWELGLCISEGTLTARSPRSRRLGQDLPGARVSAPSHAQPGLRWDPPGCCSPWAQASPGCGYEEQSLGCLQSGRAAHTRSLPQKFRV